MNPKFKINQKVWIMFANHPMEFKIETIVIRLDGIEYWFSGVFDEGVEKIGAGTKQDFFRKEKECFTTKKELTDSF